MQLHQLQPNRPSKNPSPRVGRGGKRGNTSGRGQKGQKSRSGHRIRPAERDFIIKIPKLRGYRNKPMRANAIVIGFGELSALKAPVITRDVLLEARLIHDVAAPVKVLRGGLLSRVFTLQNIPCSKSAAAAIVAYGGKVIQPVFASPTKEVPDSKPKL